MCKKTVNFCVFSKSNMAACRHFESWISYIALKKCIHYHFSTNQLKNYSFTVIYSKNTSIFKYLHFSTWPPSTILNLNLRKNTRVSHVYPADYVSRGFILPKNTKKGLRPKISQTSSSASRLYIGPNKVSIIFFFSKWPLAAILNITMITFPLNIMLHHLKLITFPNNWKNIIFNRFKWHFHKNLFFQNGCRWPFWIQIIKNLYIIYSLSNWIIFVQ